MKLINHVLDIRRLIQQAFDNRFSRMGLRATESVPEELLSADQLPRRRQLDNIMQSHLSELGDYAQARQAAINECVFTLFNRIAAIKVMESKELFPEIITRRKENAGRSFEHNVWLEDHPEERDAEREGLKFFLKDQFDKLGEHIPLYRKDYPYALMPTADELNEIIEQFNAVENDPDCGEDVWRGDDILGWLYENFNAVEKESLKQSGEKTEYNKVSLQSQVYTPQWVVKFLVDNTLGKAYLEMYPDSSIKEKYQIANAPERQLRHPKDMRQMRFLDPACGSGNFLIYAFSLFYDLYTDQMENYGREYSRRDIPKMIVENNLFGIDLDERAAQISQIALFIKARDLGGHRSHWPAYTNVVSTHFTLPTYDDVKKEFGYDASWTMKYDEVVKKIWTDLGDARKFGSLVRVEEQLHAISPTDENHSLFSEDEMTGLFYTSNHIKKQISDLVTKYSENNTNPYTLLKMSEAMTFLDFISQKYDVVVANPPYTDSGDFGKELKAFVEENYRKPLKFNTNLYACFIKRCCELAGDDGKVGMIHPLTFMFIKSFVDVRSFILEKWHINLFVDYGLDRINMFKDTGFASAPAFYVLERNNRNQYSTFFELNVGLQEKDKKYRLSEAYHRYCNGINDERIYNLPQAKLKGIKLFPFIYWISDNFRDKFSSYYLKKSADIVSGFKTGCNEALLRFWWEVEDNIKWAIYTKGGTFNKWYGNNWLKLLIEEDFSKMKNQNSYNIPRKYFERGITYNGLGSKGLCFRLLEETTLYDMGSSAVFGQHTYFLLGILNSALIRYSCNCLNPTVNVQPTDVERLPFVEINSLPDETVLLIEKLSKINVSIKKCICQFSVIEPLYEQSPIFARKEVSTSLTTYYITENALLTQILINESIINRTVFEMYELSEHDKQMVLDKEGVPVGDLPVSHEAKVAYRQWLTEESEFKPSDEVLAHLDALEECDDLPQITDFDTLYQNNNEWEEFCIKRTVNPVEAWYQFRKAGILPPQRTQTLAFELITDVIRTVLAKDDDGIIPLGDKMGEERLAIRIEREMMERGYSAAQFAQVCHLLGCPLEKYLQERFFQQLSDHLNLFMYLPKTPFIWHLTSGPHHAIELYISIYKWSRDALFRVRSIYAANRETAIRDRLNSIDTTSTTGRLEANELRAMLTELQEFCQKVDDLLASGYDPKLDDGVGKNIAPLQKRKMLSYEVLNAGQLKKYLNADW